MKLSGNFSLEDLVRTFQGNFSCQSVTKNTKGKPLTDEEHITLELFFLRADIYPKKKPALVKIYSVSEGQNGEKLLTPLVTLEGK